MARVGRLTASRAKDMLATIKSGEATARLNLRVQLVVERLTGQPQDSDYINTDMQRGIDLEPAAFGAYEGITGTVLDHCGFVAHTDLAIGCSPDGIVGDFEGVVELKVPRSTTHLGYLRSGGVPREYLAQLTHTLWVTGAEWCDFVSFDPRFQPTLQLYRVRLHRSDAPIEEYAKKARAFLAEVEAELEAVQTLNILTELEAHMDTLFDAVAAIDPRKRPSDEHA